MKGVDSIWHGACVNALKNTNWKKGNKFLCIDIEQIGELLDEQTGAVNASEIYMRH